MQKKKHSSVLCVGEAVRLKDSGGWASRLREDGTGETEIERLKLCLGTLLRQMGMVNGWCAFLRVVVPFFIKTISSANQWWFQDLRKWRMWRITER